MTVFEREDKIGGLLRYGIPNMKLEKQFIDRKIAIMEEEGVQFVTGCNIGKDKKAATLLKEFDRIVLCCGASNPRDIKVPGREAEGIYFAVDFLKSTTKALWKNAKQNADGTYDLSLKEGTYISAKGKNVMVIGGGDTGNDCVGTSMRHGAKSVLQLEMMPKAPDERTEMNPWPEWRESARQITVSRKPLPYLDMTHVYTRQPSKNSKKTKMVKSARQFW